MTQPNPYEPPQEVDQRLGWWGRLSRIFRSPRKLLGPNFRRGDAIIFDGIAYFIDPRDPEILYAASPSSENTEQRMQLLVAESIRILPKFVQAFPRLRSRIQGRRLFVRMIGNYSDNQAEYVREVEVAESDLPSVLRTKE